MENSMTKDKFITELAEAVFYFYKNNDKEDQIVDFTVNTTNPELPAVRLLWREFSDFDITLIVSDDLKITEVVDGDSNFTVEFNTIEDYILYLGDLFEIGE